MTPVSAIFCFGSKLGRSQIFLPFFFEANRTKDRVLDGIPESEWDSFNYLIAYAIRPSTVVSSLKGIENLSIAAPRSQKTVHLVALAEGILIKVSWETGRLSSILILYKPESYQHRIYFVHKTVKQLYFLVVSNLTS